MSQRDRYEPGVPCWVTTMQPDVDAAAEYYGGLFGWDYDDGGGSLTAKLRGREVAAVAPRHGAQLVNEPGAWAMSQLDTPDPEAAASFYGEVFGWTTEAFGPVTMFRLPGYVGGEPAQPVSREVVAVMMPTEDGPARWDVNFWVDDLEAAVARSEAGGGTTVQPPFETPPGRTAVLADPAGVTFSVSHVPRPG